VSFLVCFPFGYKNPHSSVHSEETLEAEESASILSAYHFHW